MAFQKYSEEKRNEILDSQQVKKCAWKNKFITEFGISQRLD